MLRSSLGKGLRGSKGRISEGSCVPRRTFWMWLNFVFNRCERLFLSVRRSMYAYWCSMYVAAVLCLQIMPPSDKV